MGNIAGRQHSTTITERAFDFLLPIRFTFMDEQQTISVKEGLKEQHTTYDRYGEIAGFGTMLLGTTTGISVAKGGIRNHKHRDSCRSRKTEWSTTVVVHRVSKSSKKSHF